jgi:crotonobetainyl-CoA:carnitine CoA-transferase CaiB-like acyl-CoA transferase
MNDAGPQSPLSGIRVVDASTLFAGPLAAMHLGDCGADVVKVEHPNTPDPSRGHGPEKNGSNLWWKTLGRNKRNIAVNLASPGGADVFLRLVKASDVLIENFRPGVLERWGLSPERLLGENPELVIVRVTAFGQSGPYSSRPGFGTIAEAMSGFAAVTGEVGGAPTLPPFGLADGIAGITAAFAALTALAGRSRSGKGGVVDLAIYEPMMMMMGPQITAFDQLGVVQPRTGNRSANNAPRNTYLTKDQKWVAVSTSSQSIADRVMTMVGASDLISEEWFSSGKGRAEHADLLDGIVGEWIANRVLEEVLGAFEKAQAAVALVYDIRDIFADQHILHRGTIAEVQDDELGVVKMQAPLFKFQNLQGQIKWTGRRHGADTEEVLLELGYQPGQIEGLRQSKEIK